MAELVNELVMFPRGLQFWFGVGEENAVINICFCIVKTLYIDYF
jgi:hypothetical protein